MRCPSMRRFPGCEFADGQAPEPGDAALAAGEDGGPAAECRGYVGLGEPGDRGQVPYGDGAARGKQPVQGDGEPLPGRVEIHDAAASASASSPGVLCCVSIAVLLVQLVRQGR